MIDLFEILGMILTVFFLIVVLILAIAILLIYYSVKTKKVLFTGFVLFVLDLRYYLL